MTGVAGQPRAFQPEHDPGPTQRHLGDQLLEPFPVLGRGTGLAWSMSITLIWSSAQPSAIARPRRSYWRTADSVLWENLTDRGLADIP